ncbi:MAG: hypothetical protein PHU08_02535 [Dehalococcoidales bacterium]|nr:hypothetical protein [Dehalococcoidales bacterium]
MPNLPPAFNDHLFYDLDKPQSVVERIFTPIILELINYLNGLPCLSDIQHIRKTSGRTTRQLGRPFNLRPNDIYTRHWYIYNWGGRNEMQFNIGMYSANDQETPYVRIGAGFNFDRARFGNPSEVAGAFSNFSGKVAANQRIFETFVQNQLLQVEFTPNVNVRNIVGWLQSEAHKNADEHNENWIFIGRQLYRERDRTILENPQLLNEVIKSVFGGFKLYY